MPREAPLSVRRRRSTQSAAQKFSFLSPGPKPLRVSPVAIRWQLTNSQDITTGAPQKLFRHLHDAIGEFGYRVVETHEPQIVGQAIGDTGTAEGDVLAESNVVEFGNSALRLVGLCLLVIGIGITLWALTAGLSALGALVFGLVFVFVGAVLARLHAFRSDVVYVHLKGEAYRSGLTAGTRMSTEIADTQRLSVISELRLSVYGATIESKNTGETRVFMRTLSSPNLGGEFQLLVDNVTTNVLPKVLLQKSWEQTRHESGYSAPMVVKEVTHEVLIRCGYCRTVNPDGELVCQKCGASLK